MNIENNFNQFLEDILLFNNDLINTLSAASVENYREEYKGMD